MLRVIVLLATVFAFSRGSQEAPPFRTAVYHSRLGPWTGLDGMDKALVGAFNDKLNDTEWLQREEIPDWPKTKFLDVIVDGFRAFVGAIDVSYFIGTLDTETLAKDGLLHDLTDLYEEEGWFDSFNQGILGATALPSTERRFSVPLVYSLFGVYYLDSVLQEAGVGIPRTFEQMLAICEVFRARGSPACFATAAPGTLGDMDVFVWLDHLFLSMHGHDAFLAWLRGDLAYTEDGMFAETLEKLTELLEDGIISTEHHVQAFTDGVTPFLFHVETVLASELGSPGFLGDLRVLSFPPLQESPHQRVVVSVVATNVVPSNARSPDLGKEFVRFLGSLEAQQLITATAPFILPVRVTPNTTLTPTTRQLVEEIDQRESKLMVTEYSRDAMQGRLVVRAVREDLPLFFRSTEPRVPQIPGLLSRLEALRIADFFHVAQIPTFSAPSGTYNQSVTVALSSATPNATIYYTLDGSYPFEQSFEYAMPIVLENTGTRDAETVTVRCVAVAPDLTPSLVARADYHLLPMGSFPGSASSSDLQTTAVVVAAVVAAAMLLLVATMGLLWRRVRHRETVFRIDEDSNLVIPAEEIRLLEVIGQGGYGRVYRAQWAGVVVAVKQDRRLRSKASDAGGKSGKTDVGDKVKTGGNSDHGKQRMRMFLREAGVMVRLRHPYIVSLMGICVTPHLALVTEYLERGSLFAILHSGVELSVSLRHQWALQIAQGLAFLHGLNPPILHRDLKSPNVLISKEWVPKLSDFGLSSLSAERLSPSTLTAGTGSGSQGIAATAVDTASPNRRASPLEGLLSHGDVRHVGTVNWSAPEILINVDNFAEASDVYAYGILVWEVVMRKVPYEAMGPMCIAMRVATEKLRPGLDEIPADYGLLAEIMQGCWQQEPEDRWSLHEVRRSLEGVVRPEEVVVPRESLVPRDDARAVLVGVSLGSLCSCALSQNPHAYVAYVRGMQALCERLVRAHDGFLWEETPVRLLAAFRTEADAMAFAGGLSCAVVTPIVSPFSNKMAKLTRLPLDFAPAPLVCALAAVTGSTVFARVAGNRVVFRGSVVTQLRTTLAAAPVGFITFPGTMFAAFADALPQELRSSPRSTQQLPGGVANLVRVLTDGQVEAGVAQLFGGLSKEQSSRPLDQSRSQVPVSAMTPVASSVEVGRAPSLLSQSLNVVTVPLQSASDEASISRSTCPSTYPPYSRTTGTSSYPPSSSYTRSSPLSRSDTVESSYESSTSQSPSLSSRLSADSEQQEEAVGTRGKGKEGEGETGAGVGKGEGARTRQRLFESWVITEKDLASLDRRRFPQFAAGKLFVSQRVATQAGTMVIRQLLRQPASLEELLMFAELTSTTRLFEHPNLAVPLHVCLDPGSVLLVYRAVSPGGMNMLLGTDKHVRLCGRPKRCGMIVQDMLRALAHLESIGGMYGGLLSPSKVLLSMDGHAVLAGWGLHHLTSQGITMTAPRDVLYMAPECLMDDAPASITSDVYTFGCIVLELYSAQPLYEAHHAGLEVALAVTNGVRPTIPPSLSPRVSALISACFADAASRPSFSDLRDMWREESARTPLSRTQEFSLGANQVSVLSNGSVDSVALLGSQPAAP